MISLLFYATVNRLSKVGVAFLCVASVPLDAPHYSRVITRDN